MIRTQLILAALMGAVSSSALAEPSTAIDSPSRQSSVGNQISLHPVSLLINHLNIEYERRASPTWSLLVAPKVGLSKLTSIEGLDMLSRSVGLEAGGRWYPGQGSLHGFFLQPSASYHAYFLSTDFGVAHGLGLHGKAGYQWFAADRVALHLAGGVQYQAIVANDHSELASDSRKNNRARGFLPDFSFGIGIGF